MISQEIINDILSASKIEDIISLYTPLKKKGITYEGYCPFHNEKTPSFKVSSIKGIFKCFGCGKSGNVVKFIMEHEKFTYPEALRFLAQKANINVPSDNFYSKEESFVSKTILGAIELASDIFNEKLKEDSTEAKKVFQYLQDRSISKESIDKFKIGFSPNQYSLISDKLKEYDYDNFVLEKSGLSILKDGVTYDRFRNRIMFPIFNLSDKVIAFGGRILDEDKKKSKYINSPETELYNKSKVLYGLNFAKKAIVKNDNCYLVEGYTDVIMLHQIGIENVVSSSGTSLTSEQIKLIYRYTKNITILYDGDDAGIKASFRGIDMILEEDMNVKIVLFPDNEDPDSFCRKNSKNYVLDFIENNSVDFIIYKTNSLKSKYVSNTDIIEKTDTINEIITTLSKISDIVKRGVYITECSKIFNVKESALSEKIDNIILKTKSKKTVYSKKYLEQEYGNNSERDIIRLLINHGNTDIEIDAFNDENELVTTFIPLSLFIVFDIRNDDLLFEDKLFQSIFDEYEQLIKSNKHVPENYFSNHSNKLISDFTSSIIDIPINISKAWDEESLNIKKITIKSLLLFKMKIIEKKIDVNTIEINNSTNDNIIVDLLKRRETLIGIKKELYKQLKIY